MGLGRSCRDMKYRPAPCGEEVGVVGRDHSPVSWALGAEACWRWWWRLTAAMERKLFPRSFHRPGRGLCFLGPGGDRLGLGWGNRGGGSPIRSSRDVPPCALPTSVCCATGRTSERAGQGPHSCEGGCWAGGLPRPHRHRVLCLRVPAPARAAALSSLACLPSWPPPVSTPPSPGQGMGTIQPIHGSVSCLGPGPWPLGPVSPAVNSFSPLSSGGSSPKPGCSLLSDSESL